MRGKKTAARTPQTSGGKSYLLDDDDRIRVEIPHPKVVVDERETRSFNEFLRVQAGADARDFLGMELDVRPAGNLGKKEGERLEEQHTQAELRRPKHHRFRVV